MQGVVIALAALVAAGGCVIDAEPCSEQRCLDTSHGDAEPAARTPWETCIGVDHRYTFGARRLERSALPAHQPDWQKRWIWGTDFWKLRPGSPQYPASGHATLSIEDWSLPVDQWGDQPGSQFMSPEPTRYGVFARVPDYWHEAGVQYEIDYQGQRAVIERDQVEDAQRCTDRHCEGLWLDLGDHVLGDGATITVSRISRFATMFVGPIVLVECESW